MKAAAVIPLNELSKLFYCLDRLGYAPVARMHFELRGGAIDAERLRRACSLQLTRYPVFNARCQDRSSAAAWRLCWVPGENSERNGAVREYDLTGLTAGTAQQRVSALIADISAGLTAVRSRPFRLAVFRLPDCRWEIVAFFHHAAADAYSYNTFLTDIFSTYNRLGSGTGQTTPDTGRPHAETFPLLPVTAWETITGLWGAVCIIASQIRRRGGRLPHKLVYGKSSFNGGTGVVERCLGPDSLTRYAAAARRLQTTVNDLLVAALIAALEQWKTTRGEPCETISVQIHKNIRKTAAERREMTNRFSTIIITTQKKERGSLTGIARQVSRLRASAYKRRMAEKIICFLWFLNSRVAEKTIVSWGNRILNNTVLGDSLAVSNMGTVRAGSDGGRLGSAEITACYLYSPPIPSVGTSVSFCTFRKRLFLSFNYFTWALSEKQAHSFAAVYAGVLEKLVDSIP